MDRRVSESISPGATPPLPRHDCRLTWIRSLGRVRRALLRARVALWAEFSHTTRAGILWTESSLRLRQAPYCRYHKRRQHISHQLVTVKVISRPAA